LATPLEIALIRSCVFGARFPFAVVLRLLSYELPQVRPNTLQRRHGKIGQGKSLSRNFLERLDIGKRRLQQQILWDFRNGVSIGIATRCDPTADEILIESIGSLAGGELRGISFG
jgi:hypothetical protein